MTKRKGKPFHGAWMDETLTGSKPAPSFSADAAEEFHRKWTQAEAAKLEEIILRIRNEPGKIDPAPVVEVLRRQLSLWRFECQRREQDPQPAQWDGLLRAIEVPESPDYCAVSALWRQVRNLPAQVIGVLDGALFERAKTVTGELFQRLMVDAGRGSSAFAGDVELLRSTLGDLIAELPRVKGKRGPREAKGPYFRAVVTAVRNHAADDVPVGAARALAAELLEACGVKMPSTRQDLARLAKE